MDKTGLVDWLMANSGPFKLGIGMFERAGLVKFGIGTFGRTGLFNAGNGKTGFRLPKC